MYVCLQPRAAGTCFKSSPNVCGLQSFATTFATTLESLRVHACRGGGAQGSARLCPRQPAVYNLLGGPSAHRIPVAREFSRPLSSVRTLRTIPGLSYFFVNTANGNTNGAVVKHSGDGAFSGPCFVAAMPGMRRHSNRHRGPRRCDDDWRQVGWPSVRPDDSVALWRFWRQWWEPPDSMGVLPKLKP